MPTLSVLFLRAALLYLVFGFTFGALLLVDRAFPLHPSIWLLPPAHEEFVLVGWTVQMAMGVSFRMLPRFTADNSRGNEAATWLAFALLNLGVLSASLGPALGEPGLMLLGRLAEVAGAASFVAHAWPRVKPMGV